MPKISLNAFLKMLAKSAPQKAAAYSRYLGSGGYDFYHTFKEQAKALTIEEKVFQACAEMIQKIPRKSEREHNLLCLESLDDWIGDRELAYFDPPRGVVSSPKKFLSVKLEPEFGYLHGNSRRLVCLWSSKEPALTSAMAGVGIFMIQKLLCVDGYEDCVGTILDVRKKKLFLADKIPLNVEALLNGEFAWVDGFFENFAKAA